MLLVQTRRDFLEFSVGEGEGFDLSGESHQSPLKTHPDRGTFREGKTKRGGKSTTRGARIPLPTQSHSLQHGDFRDVSTHLWCLCISQTTMDFSVFPPINLYKHHSVISQSHLGANNLEKSHFFLDSHCLFHILTRVRHSDPSPLFSDSHCCGNPSFQLGRAAGGADLAEMMSPEAPQFLFVHAGPCSRVSPGNRNSS